MRTITNFLLILVTLFVSCRKYGLDVYDEEMDKTEQLMLDCRMSAKSILLKLGQIKSEYKNFSESQKMRYELLNAEVQEKAFVKFTSDKEMKEAVEYYKMKGTDEQKMKAYYLLGCVYRDMHELPTALEWMEKASKYADTSRTSKRLAAKIYSQTSILYKECMMPQEEIEAIKKGVHLCLQTKDSTEAYNLYGHLHLIYRNIGKLDSSIIVCNTTARYFKRAALYKDAMIYDGYNAYYQILKKDYRNAKKYLDKCIGHSVMKDNDGAFQYAPKLFYVQGMCLLNEGRLPNAERCFRRSLTQTHDIQDKIDAANGLRDLYGLQAIADSVIKYADMAIRLNRLMFDKELSKNTLKTKVSYDFSHNRFLVKSQETQLKLLNVYYYLFWIACLVIMLLALALLFERNAVFKAKDLIEKQEKENVSHEIRNEQLSTELNSLYKETQITDKATIKRDQLYKMKHTDIYISIAERSDRADSILDAHDWHSLYDRMNETMPLFLHALRDYQLPKSKEMLCILLMLGFSSGQIRNLLGNPKINISTEKKRLLKKMFDQEGTPNDFDVYLKDI